MRFLKSLGLAAIVAITAMAFVSPSSAGATSSLLCTNDVELNGAGCTQPSNVHFLSVGLNASKQWADSHAVLLTSFGITVECNVLIQGAVLQGLVVSGPVVIDVTAAGVVFSNCLNGCTVGALKGGSITVLKIGSESAEVGASGFEIEVKCSGLICVYGTTGLIGAGSGPLVGGTWGQIVYAKQKVVFIKGILCPKTSELDATFESLQNNPIYVRA